MQQRLGEIAGPFRFWKIIYICAARPTRDPDGDLGGVQFLCPFHDQDTGFVLKLPAYRIWGYTPKLSQFLRFVVLFEGVHTMFYRPDEDVERGSE
jgi:hypothetical protein